MLLFTYTSFQWSTFFLLSLPLTASALGLTCPYSLGAFSSFRNSSSISWWIDSQHQGQHLGLCFLVLDVVQSTDDYDLSRN